MIPVLEGHFSGVRMLGREDFLNFSDLSVLSVVSLAGICWHSVVFSGWLRKLSFWCSAVSLLCQLLIYCLLAPNSLFIARSVIKELAGAGGAEEVGIVPFRPGGGSFLAEGHQCDPSW